MSFLNNRASNPSHRQSSIYTVAHHIQKMILTSQTYLHQFKNTKIPYKHTTPHSASLHKHTIAHHSISHHTKPHHTTPHHTTSYHTTQNHTKLHHTTLHHTTPHHTTPHHTTPHHTIPLHTTPYQSTQTHHIISHPTTQQKLPSRYQYQHFLFPAQHHLPSTPVLSLRAATISGPKCRSCKWRFSLRGSETSCDLQLKSIDLIQAY